MDPRDAPTQIEHYSNDNEQADRCRRLARSINDRETARLLEDMADKYERRGSAAD